MEYLWTPWRYRYVAAGHRDGCVFCEALSANRDAEALIALRGKQNFIILNRFPYTSGHVMIVPYAHCATLEECAPAALTEMIELARRLEAALETMYHPQGYNLGMNIGRVAGAGIAGHLHMHLLPRWAGDTNFMTTVGQTRLEPEDLGVTYKRLRQALGVEDTA